MKGNARLLSQVVLSTCVVAGIGTYIVFNSFDDVPVEHRTPGLVAGGDESGRLELRCEGPGDLAIEFHVGIVESESHYGASVTVQFDDGQAEQTTFVKLRDGVFIPRSNDDFAGRLGESEIVRVKWPSWRARSLTVSYSVQKELRDLLSSCH